MSHFGRQYANDYIRSEIQNYWLWAIDPKREDCDWCCGGGDEYWRDTRRNVQAAVDYLRAHKYPLPRMYCGVRQHTFDTMLKHKPEAWLDYYIKP